MPSEEYAKYVKQMRDWLNSQEHLPKDVPDSLLYRFAYSCYFDLDKAKKAADLFFTLRGNSPELLSDRDHTAPHMQKLIKIVNAATIEISGNRKLWIWQLNDPGLENYEYILDAKFFFLTTDAWLLQNDDKYYECDIVMMDLKDISLKMLTKLNMSIAKKLSKYQQEAIPIRLKQIHLVNTPPIIDKLFLFFKTLLKKEVSELIHFHQPESDTLYKYFSKDELPKDYGGTLDSMETYMVKTVKFLDDNRKLLQNENLWVATKKMKSSSVQSTDIGSFRTLAID